MKFHVEFDIEVENNEQEIKDILEDNFLTSKEMKTIKITEIEET
jgi:hypothetical protein